MEQYGPAMTNGDGIEAVQKNLCGIPTLVGIPGKLQFAR